MSIYGYCVLPRQQTPAAGLHGIDGSAVRAWVVADLGVWVSDIDRPDPAIERIQAHNAVVESAVTDAVTPVPLRFGQWSADAAAFEAAIAAKAQWYQERLAVFAGALEFGLRIVRPDHPPSARLVRVPPAETGTAYMQALRARTAAARGQLEAAEEIRVRVAQAVRDLAREERVDDATTPHGIVTISHLVGRKDFDRYRDAVQRLRSELLDLRFLLSGPWPPYTFAT